MIGRLSHISDVTQRALAAERRLAEHMATTGVTLTTIRYYLLLCNNISMEKYLPFMQVIIKVHPKISFVITSINMFLKEMFSVWRVVTGEDSF